MYPCHIDSCKPRTPRIVCMINVGKYNIVFIFVDKHDSGSFVKLCTIDTRNSSKRLSVGYQIGFCSAAFTKNV